ncbi:MAG: DUF4411 family protein [Bacteroidota bacterium]
MSSLFTSYCLDTNVLIQAWNTYYSPKFCPDYWKVLDELGEQGIIFLPKIVNDEIIKVDDNLAAWIKNSKIKIHPINTEVTECLKKINIINTDHKYLVSENGKHSIADPWVIAHAMEQNAIVVTKEIKDAITKPTKIKIPHVCHNMNVRWIDDFQMIDELNIQFSCHIHN